MGVSMMAIMGGMVIIVSVVMAIMAKPRVVVFPGVDKFQWSQFQDATLFFFSLIF